MIVFAAQVGEYYVELMCDGTSETYLRVDHVPSKITTIDMTFKTARTASASLRDGIGLAYAIEFLEQSGVQRTHPLWDLNHSDLWVR